MMIINHPMVEIGDEAPNAILRKSTSKTVNEEFELKQAYHENRVILYFFPAVFTGVCTKSSCEIRDTIDDYNQENTQIYAVSTDLPFSQYKFIEDNEINYPVLSDWNNEAITKFDIVDNEFFGFFKGVSKRALFLIENGKISYKWVADNPSQYPPFEKLKDHLT